MPTLGGPQSNLRFHLFSKPHIQTALFIFIRLTGQCMHPYKCGKLRARFL